MFHPDKPWRLPFSALVMCHNVARYAPDFLSSNGLPYSTDPLDYGAARSGLNYPHVGQIVSDQRISGMNALLWRDPSMVL